MTAIFNPAPQRPWLMAFNVLELAIPLHVDQPYPKALPTCFLDNKILLDFYYESEHTTCMNLVELRIRTATSQKAKWQLMDNMFISCNHFPDSIKIEKLMLIPMRFCDRLHNKELGDSVMIYYPNYEDTYHMFGTISEITEHHASIKITEIGHARDKRQLTYLNL